MMRVAEFRILIADDDPIVCRLLRNSVASQPGMQIVGEAPDGPQTLSLIEKFRPDALILDFLMPTMHGMEVLQAVRMNFVHVAIIVVAASITKQEAIEAFHLGARAVLPKRCVHMLPECLVCVRNGGYWAEEQCFGTLHDVLAHLVQQPEPVGTAKPWQLTRRELQVIRLAASGKTNYEIAAILAIREATVKRHLANVFEKCGVSNRVELATFASHNDLI